MLIGDGGDRGLWTIRNDDHGLCPTRSGDRARPGPCVRGRDRGRPWPGSGRRPPRARAPCPAWRKRIRSWPAKQAAQQQLQRNVSSGSLSPRVIAIRHKFPTNAFVPSKPN